MISNEHRDRPSKTVARQTHSTSESWKDDRDLSSESNDPPNHGQVTTPGSSARFLQWVGKLDRDVSVSDLGDLYQEWRERQDTGEQADLHQWGDDE